MLPFGERLLEYRDGAFKNVKGWVGGKVPDLLEAVCGFQEDRSIGGDILEIGVYQGKFFLALAAVLRDDEIAVAVDLFNEQSLSVDNSNYDRDLLSMFSDHVSQYVRIRLASASSPPTP